MSDCGVNCIALADIITVLIITAICIVIGLVAFVVWAVVFAQANNYFGNCLKCGGGLSKVYIVGNSRNDLVICDKCETIFMQFNGGELFEVFGHPPLTKGGNHEQR